MGRRLSAFSCRLSQRILVAVVALLLFLLMLASASIAADADEPVEEIAGIAAAPAMAGGPGVPGVNDARDLRVIAAAFEQQTPSGTHTPENPHHIFLVIPAYKVEYRKRVPPLTPHEKLHEFLESTYDPLGLTFSAGEALLLEHSSSDGFCGYGHGAVNFLKCYGSARLDANVSGFFGDYLFPVWMHQDPRYFRIGPDASFGTRVLYAISRVFVTRNDNTRDDQFYYSALAGTVLAGVVSNTYYPHSDRGVRLTMSRIAIDLAGTATFDLSAEFWEDIKEKVKARGR